MSVNLWDTRKIETHRINGVERRVFVIPRNVEARTPEFVFTVGLPQEAIQLFLTGIQNKHGDNRLITYGVERRYSLGGDVSPIYFVPESFAVLGSLGRAPHQVGENPFTFGIGNRLGLSGIVEATFVDVRHPHPISIASDYWTERKAQAYGFLSINSALASTLAHELAHLFIMEPFSSGLSGHAEVLARFGGGGPFTGLTRSDILYEDIMAAQIGFSRANGLFLEAGENKFIDGRITAFNRAAERLPNIREFLIGGRRDLLGDLAQRMESTAIEVDGYSDNEHGVHTTVLSVRVPTHLPQIDSVTGAALPRGLRRTASALGVVPGYSSDGTVVLDRQFRRVELDVADVNGVQTVVGSRASDGWGRNGPGVTVETIYANERPVSTNIKLNNNPLGVEFSQAGGILGQQLGYLIAGGNKLTGIVASAALQTIGDNLGDVLDGLVGNMSVNKAAKDAFATTGAELLHNLKSAGVGAVSSYLTAELIKAIGVDGFAGELLNTAAGTVINTMVTNLASGAAVFQGLSIAQIGTAVGSFLGTKLASELVSFDTIGGQLGAAVGSSLGAIGGAAVATVGTAKGALLGGKLGAAAGPVGAAIGAFVGFLVGGMIGSVFGGTPRSGADVVWDAGKQAFVAANVYARKGGSKDAARGVAAAVAETFNGILAAAGGTLINPQLVQAGNYGMRKGDFVYRPRSTQDKEAITHSFTGKDAAQKLIGHGLYQGLTDPDFKIAGGDVPVPRLKRVSRAQAEGRAMPVAANDRVTQVLCTAA
jgi:hypothetical protein